MKWASMLVVLAAGCGNSGESLVDSVVGSSRVQQACRGEADSDIATVASIYRAAREEGFSRLEAMDIAEESCDSVCGLDDFCYLDCLNCTVAVIDAVYDR